MDQFFFFKMIFLDLDSDKKFEMAGQVAIKEERSSLYGCSNKYTDSLGAINFKPTKNNFSDYFTNPPIYYHKYF